MLLSEFVDRIYAVEKLICVDYAADLRAVVRQFGEFIGHAAKLGDLDETTLSRFVQSLESTARPRTIKNKRVILLTLWQAAADRGLAREPLRRRVRPVRVPQEPPTAWTLDELRRLVRAAEGLRGYDPRTGIAWSAFFVAFVRTKFGTGLRLGDMLRLERRQIREGVLATVQNKTGRFVYHRLSAETLAAIEATFPPSRSLIFPWPRKLDALCKKFKGLVKAAEIPPGTTRWLRRSSASYVELARPGAARAHLGHATGDMWRRYVDPRIAYADLPLPPEIDPPGEVG